jgi:hypothetical protein
VDAFMKIDQKCIIEKLEKINLVEIVNWRKFVRKLRDINL